MQNSAKSRRTSFVRRLSSFPDRCALDTARRPSVRLAHLMCMNEPARTLPGLESVLTTSELAAHLGVPVQTIHDLRHSGRGPRGIRVGRELRFRLSEIQSWLADLEEHDDAVSTSAGSAR